MWSTSGDIAAGSSSKTVKSAPPTRVVIDPQSADVMPDLAGLALPAAVLVFLATVADVAPGNVDLIAPQGTIDAGDAGIRATGSVSVAAAGSRQCRQHHRRRLRNGSSAAPRPPLRISRGLSAGSAPARRSHVRHGKCRKSGGRSGLRNSSPLLLSSLSKSVGTAAEAGTTMTENKCCDKTIVARFLTKYCNFGFSRCPTTGSQLRENRIPKL